MRNKIIYAVKAAVILNILWWGMTYLGEKNGMGGFIEGIVALGILGAACLFQVAGYCYFQWRFQGKALLFNGIFFSAMLICSNLFAVLMGLMDGTIKGVLYVFYMYILYWVYAKILWVRLAVGLAKMAGEIQERGKKIASVCGMLFFLVLFFFDFTLWNVMSFHSPDVFLADDAAIEQTYNDTAEFIEGMQKRREESEQRKQEAQKEREEKRAREEERRKEEEQRQEFEYASRCNKEECKRLIKLVKMTKGDNWSEEDVIDWSALRWEEYEGEHYVTEMNCNGDHSLKGALDLSGFPYLTEINFSYTDIEEVILPENMDRLSENEFLCCEKLKKITFGKNFKILNRNVLDGSRKQEEVVFRGDEPLIYEIPDLWEEAKIYYKKGTDGWDKSRWSGYHLVPYSKK